MCNKTDHTHCFHAAPHKAIERYIPYNRGMSEVAKGCYAWFEPPGGWGLCNSGVLKFGNEIVVIDTQVDVNRGKQLRKAVEALAGTAVISTVVNTHDDGDHWNGNMFWKEVPIIATEVAAEGMRKQRIDPRAFANLPEDAGPNVREFAKWRTSEYHYEGWEPHFPTVTFKGRRKLLVGSTEVDIIQVGPAHSAGDAIVHVPETGVVYAGDVIVNRSTPVAWVSVEHFLKAIDFIISLKPSLIVSGHGPVTDVGGALEVRRYLELILEHSLKRFDAGDSIEQAFRSFDLGEYRLWPHSAVALQTIRTIYMEKNCSRVDLTWFEALEIVIGEDRN